MTFPQESGHSQWVTMKENVQMTKKPRRLFTDEQKAEAVNIVKQSGKPVSQVAKEMGLTESALRKWGIINSANFPEAVAHSQISLTWQCLWTEKTDNP